MTACHECWQCREHAVLDWVGRNIAESKTAKASSAITLTYGRNEANEVHHERTVILTYSDVQIYLKALRRHGYPIRYFVTGENGSKKGRAHWHIIAYWQDRVPEHVLDRNVMEEHWPHGWSYWTKLRPHSAKYNCKYVLKDWTDTQSQSHLAMSKKPPLGYQFFQDRALQYVKQGLAPQDLFYTHPEAKQRNRQGGHDYMKFMLGGRSAELFLQGYIDLWERERGNKPRPKSELVDRFERYGRVVSDSLLETLVDQEWAARDRDAKREKKTSGGGCMNREDWWFKWILQAEDEQERQRRREEFEWWQQLDWQQRIDRVWDEGEHEYERKRQEYGTFWPTWQQWCADNVRSRPDLRGEYRAGPVGGPQSKPGRNAALVVPDDWRRAANGQSGAGSGHQSIPDDALGPIGTYNRNYASSAGPGETGTSQS